MRERDSRDCGPFKVPELGKGRSQLFLVIIQQRLVRYDNQRFSQPKNVNDGPRACTCESVNLELR